MSQFSGMNVESITSQVVLGFRNQSESVRSVIQGVERLIGIVETEWKGNDSRQFIQKWQGEYRGPLQQLAEELDNLGVLAGRNAEAQRANSSTL